MRNILINRQSSRKFPFVWLFSIAISNALLDRTAILGIHFDKIVSIVARGKVYTLHNIVKGIIKLPNTFKLPQPECI